MPKPEDYDMLDADEIRDRLAKAETVCVLFGWSAIAPESPGNDATHEAWVEWNDLVGSDYTGPKAHPDLNEKRIHDLAQKRRDTRAATLKSIDDGTWGKKR